MLEYEIVVISKKSNLKIVSQLIKTETSLGIWLNIVTTVARSVRLLPAYTRKDVLATRQLHVNDGLVSAIPNMQKTLPQFTTLV